MLKLSAQEIANILGAEFYGSSAAMVSNVETDSRKVSAGSLFVAKPGEHTDGHLFVGSAVQSGATATLVQRRVAEDVAQIVVPDVVEAMGRLAQHVVAQVRSKGVLKVIGVTGSNGKTTTKNMLREILSQVGETVAPEESFNNEVGAPYSMLKISDQTKFLVVELGAGGPGSIRYLTELAAPDIGIELKVGLAHVGEFGGIESTEDIKAELVEELTEGAVALLNIDDPRVAAMRSRTKARVLTFGSSASAQFRATDISISIRGTSFSYHSPRSTNTLVRLQIIGEHHVYNALAALATAELLGIDPDKAVAALEAMPRAERWRMEVNHRSDGLTIINDAYNASPDSTRAALQTLAELGRQSGKPTVAVLGEMAELGEFSRDEHDAIGRLAVRLNLSQLVVVGSGAKMIHMGASLEGSWDGESKFFEQITEAESYLREMLTSDEIILIKSSKSANLRYLGDSLLEETK